MIILVVVPRAIDEQLLQLIFALNELHVDGGLIKCFERDGLIFRFDFRFETILQRRHVVKIIILCLAIFNGNILSRRHNTVIGISFRSMVLGAKLDL